MLAADVEAQIETSHRYVSTACVHDLHLRCRQNCKFCMAPCLCACHRPASEAVRLAWEPNPDGP